MNYSEFSREAEAERKWEKRRGVAGCFKELTHVPVGMAGLISGAGCKFRPDICVAVLRQNSFSPGNPAFVFKTFMHCGGNHL